MDDFLSQLPIWVNSIVIIAAVVAVAKGADMVVEAASGLAARLGISELVIGLTVVALGTSAPEMAVTLISAFQGHGDISVGNIVGSNIFNLGFILGGAALLRPIPASSELIRRDGLMLLVSTLVLFVMVSFGLELGTTDGMILLGMLAFYLAVLFIQRGKGVDSVESLDELDTGRSVKSNFKTLLLGLVVVVIGSHLLVGSSVAIARHAGVSEWVIGVTIIAAGTSMPEMATTFAALLRKRYAISAGALIGSDIFNVLAVLGVAGVLQPVTVDPAARFSLLFLVGGVALAVFFMATGRKISRLEGLVLLLLASGRWVLDWMTRI